MGYAGTQIVSEEAPEFSTTSPYWNLLQVEVEREDGSSSRVSGTVFGNEPHIVQVDEFNDLFAFRPEANYILSFKNIDRPGAISEVRNVHYTVCCTVYCTVLCTALCAARCTAGCTALSTVQ